MEKEINDGYVITDRLAVDLTVLAAFEYVLWHKICLLYTSPSPRDRTRYRMPSSAGKKTSTSCLYPRSCTLFTLFCCHQLYLYML